jgi:signal transduction histidine kinase/AmiR/NasT family two-component response regulator
MVAASEVQSGTQAGIPADGAAAPEPALAINADGALAMQAPLKGLSFQRRIAVVALLTSVAVLLAACLLFLFEQWRIEREQLSQSQAALAQVMADNLAGPLSSGDFSTVQDRLTHINAAQRVRSAYVVGPNGMRVANFIRKPLDKAQGSGLVRIEAPIQAQGRKIGQLVVMSRPDGMASILPRFVALGGGLFFAATGLALFTGRWLAAQITRPINRLSRAMREVARSRDFMRKVKRIEDDEFGRLTDSFNDLLGQLHNYDQDLREAMAELVEARDTAQAANVLKSQFLANMSHEIRTPLNGVLAMAQIMAMGDLAPAQRERLDVIRQSGEALLAVLNDVLDLSKIEAGRMELEIADFDTADLARQVLANYEQVAAKKGLAFSLDVQDSAQGVRRGDCGRLLQIINNLVSNAIKFTDKGGVKVEIAGEGPTGADGVLISITDTGCGVPADKLPLLFQKFVQVDASATRKFGGTGLGLAICRELAQLMGGQVWAESEEDKGSTFRISVPLQRVRDADAAAPRPAPAQPETLSAPAAAPVAANAPDVSDIAANADNSDIATEADEDRALRVLAAEDNPTNQLVLRTVMATFGVELEITGDGSQAVEAWRDGDYDVILMDIQMPVMDGVTATKTIRAEEAATGRKRIPIVALSANAMTHQVKEYLAAGMDMHVPKPIELGRLHAALQQVLSDAGEEEASRSEGAVA